MKNITKLTIASSCITTVLFLVWMDVFHISSLINTFLLIEIGKFSGPILGLILASAVTAIFPILSAIPLLRFEKGKLNKMAFTSIRRHRKRVIGIIFIGFTLSFTVTFLLSAPFMLQIKDSDKKIDAFVLRNSNESLADFVENLTFFLNENLNNSYKRTESLFEIDSKLSQTLIDPIIMQTWNVTAADVILNQSWGSCGQAAILLAQVMHNAGYESRIAHFKGVDHEMGRSK